MRNHTRRKITSHANRLEHEIASLMESTYIDAEHDLYSADGELLFSIRAKYCAKHVNEEAANEVRARHLEARTASADISLENYVK